MATKRLRAASRRANANPKYKDKGKNYVKDKNATDKRIAKRNTKIEKMDGKKSGTGAKPKSGRSKQVTQDNRKEARANTRKMNKERVKAGKPKTGGYSGVSVNNKIVRQGKVKAGEKVVKKALVKGAKTLAKRAGVLGMGASLAADLVDSQKPKTFRNRKTAQEDTKKARENKNKPKTSPKPKAKSMEKPKSKPKPKPKAPTKPKAPAKAPDKPKMDKPKAPKAKMSSKPNSKVPMDKPKKPSMPCLKRRDNKASQDSLNRLIGKRQSRGHKGNK